MDEVSKMVLADLIKRIKVLERKFEYLLNGLSQMGQFESRVGKDDIDSNVSGQIADDEGASESQI